LDDPVHAGSIFKLVVARAALTEGIVTRETRVLCPRIVNVHGRRVDCVHPDLGRPLTLADALAHSCNHFFLRVSERLDRAALAATLRRLSGGSLTLTADAPLALVVLGLDGPRAGMLTWARIALGVLTNGREQGEAGLLQAGAMRAASEGTANALSDTATLTLAKTSTTMPDGAAQEGRVVAWRPEIGEVIVVRAPGVPGRDAARVARAVWDAARTSAEPLVRVGRVGSAGPATLAMESIPLETYVAGVVAAEGESQMAPVALQALAVLTRSYVHMPDPRHRRDGYDVCDTTHCQVLGTPTAWSRDAAARTRGMLLAHNSTPVTVPYSASCSGVLSSPRDVWGGTAPLITRTGRDPAEHPVEPWRSEVEAPALLAALREAGHRGDHLRDLRISARTVDGIPTRVTLDGLMPADADATTFRHVVGRRLGWDVLKSHAWDVTRTARGYRFTGRGKGHGAGMCVRGAATLALRGWSLERVLSTYVPGASIRVAEDDVVVRVPGAMTADAARLRASVESLLADVRARLAVSTPRHVTVVLHPTREAFQRATGRAWWTSASTRHLDGHRYRVDLAPAPTVAATVLAADNSAAGTWDDGLMTTLRHELVHVLTAPALEWAPLWAAEGLAHVVSRPAAADGPATSSPCPADEAVLRPGSREAMRDAYTSAAACVVATLPDGLSTWRQLVAAY
jgi:SpoIID/LytB domain protein